MAKQLVSDTLWTIIEPHIPVRQRRKCHTGRKPLPDRACLTGVVFVLLSGVPWEMLPQEMGCGSGMTCWRRLRDWKRAGVWDTIHRILLDKLRQADQIDFSRCAVDSATLRAVGGANTPALVPSTGENPARSTTC